MDPDFIQIFSNEAKIIAQLNHPQIVRVYDIEELYHTIFIVMEYLEGTPSNRFWRIQKSSRSQKPSISFFRHATGLNMHINTA